MCHIKPSSKYFATLDLCSGYHQIAVYEDSSGLMVNHNIVLGDPLMEVKEKNEHFLRLAKKKNLKLKTYKFRISEKVKFGGSVVSKDVVNILSKNGRIKAFLN